MEFKTWLEETISDYLSKVDAKANKAAIRNFLQQRLRGRDLDVAVNLFTYLYYQEKTDPRQIEHDWQHFGDYLTVNLTPNRNAFLHHITRKELENLNLAYHRDLTVSNNLRKGPEGHPIVNVSDMLRNIANQIKLPRNYDADIWEDWNWISLGHGYSKEEGAAGGHCGNASCKTGDNIVSLRNPNGHVLLTFVINTHTGELGEAKGLNNKRPTKEYHPAIVALLLSPYVKKYKGGGYQVEEEGITNFTPEDLKVTPEIYEFVVKHLGKKTDHQIPENYYQLNWLNQWTEAKIAYLKLEEKIRLLHDIIKIFENHKPYRSGDYVTNPENPDKDEWKEFETVPKIHLNFDLNKLVYDIIPHIKKSKQAIEILEGLNEIFQYNKVESELDLRLFRPDIDKTKISPKKLDYKYPDDKFRKFETVNIDATTLHYFINQLEKLLQSPRDKVDFISVLEDVGEREEGDIANKNWRMYNVYQDKIDKLINEIIVECVAKKAVPENCIFVINNILSRTNKLANYQFDFTRDRKKITVNIDEYSYGSFDKLIKNSGISLEEEIKKVFPALKKMYVSNGYSEFLGTADTNYYMVRYKNNEHEKSSNLKLAVSSLLNDLIKKEFKNRVKQETKGIAKYSDKEYWGITYFTDAIDFLKKYLKEGPSKELEAFTKRIENIYLSIYLKKIKQLKKIMIDHMKEIIQAINNRTEWNPEKNKMVPVPRPSFRRHESTLGFAEWVTKRERKCVKIPRI